MATPEPEGTTGQAALSGVGTAGSHNIWTVGTYSTSPNSLAYTLILHRNGSRWVRS